MYVNVFVQTFVFVHTFVGARHARYRSESTAHIHIHAHMYMYVSHISLFILAKVSAHDHLLVAMRVHDQSWASISILECQ